VKSELHHIALNVTDLQNAVKFYSKYFGFEEIPKPDPTTGAWLKASDGRQIHLREGEVPKDSGQHIALLVEDIYKACETLIEDGITVTSPSPIGSSLQCFLHDPAGNRLEIHQAN